jgi:hypothetical protein
MHLTNPGNFIFIWLSCKYLLWIESEVRNLVTKIRPYLFSLEDETRNIKSVGNINYDLYTPAPPEGAYCFTSVRPSVRLSFRPYKIFFVAFFSATIDGRNLIFGHKLHICMSYCGKRLWTRQIPTSCLPT